MRTRKLLDDCFLHDKERMRHGDAVAMLIERLSCVAGRDTVPLDTARGRIASQNITAPRPVPMHDNSAVDGYAFAHSSYVNSPDGLMLSGRLAAGDTQAVDLGAGECARIFTGAVMPAGADTVAMQEDCTVTGDVVRVPPGLKQGANRRLAGEDVKPGDAIVVQGSMLRAQDIAALASTGLNEIAVRRKLRVAILSTGNELVATGGTIRHGEVFDSNGPMLAALAENTGGDVSRLGIVRDEPRAIEDAVANAAATHDLVITSGGASRGEEDHMLATLDKLGSRHLWQIAVKPGRPMMFGQIGDCIVTGLPGNPVAAYVCFLLYVRTAMLLLGGAIYHEPVRYPVPAGFDIARKKPDRREFLRGSLQRDARTGALVLQKYDRDGSGLISGLRSAHGLIELPETVTSVAKGDSLAFIPFSEFGQI
jgi:molybdopterin molybdotransferase